MIRPAVRNRRERRNLWKEEKSSVGVLWDAPKVRGLSWKEAKDHYRPTRLPIDLGINQFKKQHPNEKPRVSYFKKEIWKTYESLRAE